MLWRGGRRRRAAALPAETNGTRKNQDIIVIGDSEEEQDEGLKGSHADEYEEREPERDPDYPYSEIIHDLELDSKSAVIHLAIPLQRQSDSTTHTPVAIACADGTIKLLLIPLVPPSDGDASSKVSQVNLPPLDQPARALVAKITHKDQDGLAHSHSKHSSARAGAEVLVASASSSLNISAVHLTSKTMTKRNVRSIANVNLGSPLTSLAFHPSSSSTQLLVGDAAGAVRIYDVLSVRCSMVYSTPYQGWISSAPQLARRKRVLSSAWVLGGRGILALLEDGEWGVWDVAGSIQPSKGAAGFAINGFLGSAAESAEPAKPNKPSKLAPMTPNTRKTKSETLFAGSSKATGAATTGGVTVASNSSKTASPDETLVLWYGSDIYSIPSMQQFWLRSTNSSGNLGSLYAPGMTHVSDVNLSNERITSISPIAIPSPASSLGQMNIQGDLIISAEHRLIVTDTIRPSAPTRQLFEPAAERPVSRDPDQRMLDAGDLDLGGLNRMLDSRMDDPRPRKVGFAQ